MISDQLGIIRRKYFPTKVLQSISRNRVRENPGQLENYVRARHLLLSGDPNITSIAQAQCAKWLKWIQYCDGKGLISEAAVPRGRSQHLPTVCLPRSEAVSRSFSLARLKAVPAPRLDAGVVPVIRAPSPFLRHDSQKRRAMG